MSKKTNEVATVESTTNEQVETKKALPTLEAMQAIFEEHGGKKSPVIRALSKQGYTTGEITKAIQLVFPKHIYQHTRNVLNQKFNGK